MSEHSSWRWICLVNVPVGIAALVRGEIFVDEPEQIRRDRATLLKRGLRIDYIGVILIFLGLGFLEITMDRGEREGWFTSGLIVSTATISVVSLLALVVWEDRKSTRLNSSH